MNGKPPHLSAPFFEMVMEGPVARPVEDLDDDTLRAIASSAVPEEFAHLDELVKDRKPRAGVGTITILTPSKAC
jgi:hypothetical protein